MPSITIWNRLEPRSRLNDLTSGLEARVYDPLWLLARQWQVGEFEGRDAGSPVVASVQSTAAALDRYTVAGQPPLPYDGSQPIESLIEREPARSVNDLRQTVEAGQYFQRLLSAAQLPATIAGLYRAAYPLPIPTSAASDIAAVIPVLHGVLALLW